MGSEEIEILKERAYSAIDLAKEALKKEYYNWAIFQVEQGFQLLLKYFLALKFGYYPKTHSLKILIENCSKIKKELISFYKKYREIIKILEDAYLGSRYFPFSYDKELVEKGLIAFEELKNIVENE